MREAVALTKADALAVLLARLEPGAEGLVTDGTVLAGGVSVRSQDDPGQRILFLVPSTVTTARADGESRWLRQPAEDDAPRAERNLGRPAPVGRSS